jgi:hypothetical protein
MNRHNFSAAGYATQLISMFVIELTVIFFCSPIGVEFMDRVCASSKVDCNNLLAAITGNYSAAHDTFLVTPFERRVSEIGRAKVSLLCSTGRCIF